MEKVTSRVMASGSFGIYAKRPGDLATVWFCGAGAKSHIVSEHCAHATRGEARNCQNRRRLK